MIDGKAYELPPLVSWKESQRRFRVQIWNHGIEQKEVCFSEFGYGSVQLAFEAACSKAEAERQVGLMKPPYQIHGVDEHGKPKPLGTGIYLQFNTSWKKDKTPYQLLRVVYGYQGTPSHRRQSIPLGYAGYFTIKHFNAQLKKAQELRKKWEREAAAANEQVFQEEKEIGHRRQVTHRVR